MNHMKEEEVYQKLKDYSFRLLSIRPQSTEELKTKLLLYCRKKNIPQKYISHVLDDLIGLNYLNDTDFASWFIDRRQSVKPKGEKLIRLELLQKGIDKKIIDEAFEKNNKEDKNIDFENAKKIAIKKFILYKKMDPIYAKQRLSRYLYSKGFEWDLIERVIDSFRKKE